MIEIQKPGYSVNNSCETSPKNILERKKKILKKDEYTRSGEFLCDTPIKIRITSPDQKVPQNEEGNADIFFDTLNIPTAVSNEIEAASKIPVHKHPVSHHLYSRIRGHDFIKISTKLKLFTQSVLNWERVYIELKIIATGKRTASRFVIKFYYLFFVTNNDLMNFKPKFN